MSPKSLLRHPACVSDLAEFTDESFHTVLDDPATPSPETIRTLLLCSGKVFFALDKGREERVIDDVAIVRIEQLYPFPAADLAAIVERYPELGDVRWVQDEPENQGAWSYLRQPLKRLLGERSLRYVGRDEGASPATGSYKIHQAEEQALIDQAFKRPRRMRRKKTNGAAERPASWGLAPS
jgi:2-oxoglutarate dehydrogenase complex dehydrogenase (E1) component-like enzyme